MSRVAMVLLLGLVAGCSLGQKARDEALLPALRVAAAGVEQDAQRGVEELPEEEREAASLRVSEFFGSLRSEEIPATSLLAWAAVRAYATDGIEARLAAEEIGPTVAGSLRERVTRFEEALFKYLRGGVDR